MEDLVNHPSHYGGDSTYEVIKVLEAWEIENPRIFNAIKYLARAGKKEGHPYLQDLQKGAWYLNREIERHQSQQGFEFPCESYEPQS